MAYVLAWVSGSPARASHSDLADLSRGQRRHLRQEAIEEEHCGYMVVKVCEAVFGLSAALQLSRLDRLRIMRNASLWL